MNIRQEIKTLKTLSAQAGELLLLRLRLLQMDAADQLRGALSAAALAMLAAALLFAAPAALLLAVNILLPDRIKLPLFFGAAAVFVLAAAAMLWHVPKIWRRDAERMQETLRAMQQDFAEITGSLKTEPPKEPHDEAAQ